MPHRRRPEKGSFAAHFDELVRHFREHHGERRDSKNSERDKPDIRSVHDRLFERAWREKSDKPFP